ncbi:tight adherence protein C [Marisediminicola sp. UYEF4]|uniref:type II secretion system F family protein n=1 Tax=Marisediminicola sp. UYEF4 TaxID=1756384 RepID=UPI003391FC4D
MVPLTPVVAWAVVCGLALGFGLWSLLGVVPRLNRPRLLYRVAPYLVDVSPGARALLARRTVNPLPIVGTLFSPALDRLRALLGTALGGPGSIRLRLRQSGATIGPEAFRSQQLAWALGGLGIGTGVAALFVAVRSIPLGLQLAIVVFCGVAGIFLRDHLLQRAATARLTRMTEELPTVLEFLTLSLSAGEGILDAIRRVARISRGELATELASTVAAVNTGLPFAQSLQELADGIRLPALSRAVEQVVGALERGTPLAEVLRAQAQDARDEAKRDLLETAGKKEVAMLVPLVFLILPITIVFAIYPGIFVLQLGF